MPALYGSVTLRPSLSYLTTALGGGITPKNTDQKVMLNEIGSQTTDKEKGVILMRNWLVKEIHKAL